MLRAWNRLSARAFARAEAEGRFVVDDVSPVAAAPGIRAAVLMLHGEQDHDTPPVHSRRVFDALSAPKRLILVPGAGHSQSLRYDVWPEIDAWIDQHL